MAHEWQVGSMMLRFEEPDILFSRGEGDTDADSMRAFNRKAEELAATHGRLYLITDMSKSTGMSPEARKVANEYTGGKSPFQGMAFFGASFAMRTLVNMMVRAGQLLGKADAPMNFTASEEEARAWIAEQRTRRAAKPA